MEATIQLAGQRTVKVEGDTAKELFENMAMAYEVFGEDTCGLCGSTNIRPKHRQIDKYHYYEFECQECRAFLHMGQLQDNSGGLFPVRRLLPNGKPDFKSGEYGKHNGWTMYRGEASDGRDYQPSKSSVPPQTRLAELLKANGAQNGADAALLVKFCSAGTIEFMNTRDNDSLCEQAIKQVEANARQWGNKLMAKARESA